MLMKRIVNNDVSKDSPIKCWCNDDDDDGGAVVVANSIIDT